jgi:hypothetical protein
MASDWIKMRTDLYRDPKVCMMADRLMDSDGETARYVSQHCQRDMTVTRNVTRNAVVGALVAVWGVGRQRGSRNGLDMLVRGCTVAVIDDIADLPGFGAAMEAVGWVLETEEGVVFPKFFEEFNVEPAAELKAKNALRQQRLRDRRNAESNALRNATVTSQSNARVEKSREEKSIKKEDSPEPGKTPASGPDDEPPAPSPAVPTKPKPNPPTTAALAVPVAEELPVTVMSFPVVGNPKVPTWELTAAKEREYVEAFPGLDVLGEFRKARQWLLDDPKRRKTASGMPRFLGGWLGRANDRGGGRGRFSPATKGASQDQYAIGMLFNSAKGGDGVATEVDF